MATKITTLSDRGALKIIDFNTIEALKEVAAKLGLTVERGKGQYSELEYRLQVVFKLDDAEKHAAKARKDWEDACYLIGMCPEHYGLEFTSQGRRFKVVGLSLNRPKFCVQAVEIGRDGKTYGFASTVARQIERDNPGVTFTRQTPIVREFRGNLREESL